MIRMISGEHISVNTKKFHNDMCTLESADDILKLLIHLGYLTHDFVLKQRGFPI